MIVVSTSSTSFLHFLFARNLCRTTRTTQTTQHGPPDGGGSKEKKEIQKKYYISNKQDLNTKHKLYYLKNKETIKQQQRERYISNKEAVKEQQRIYKGKNKEAIRNRAKLHYLKNREAIKEVRRIYRHNKLPRKNKIWKDPRDVAVFLEYVRQELVLRGPEDWYRISRTQISQLGGASLFSTFGSLGKALEFAYPDVTWDQSKFSLRGKKANQRWLRVVLEQILPEGTIVLEDYMHPDLLWDETSQLKMELDIWVPKYQLAIEYQGEHHYHDLHAAYGPSGTLALYTKRDLKKKNSCLERGITLVTIPYWWDGQKGSLLSALHEHLPHIFPNTPSMSPLAQKPNQPEVGKNITNTNHAIAAFLMHGKDWNGEQDLKGWWISEKLDGFRAFWDGSQLFSRKGTPLAVPLEFTSSFPREVCLDGELWVGYQQFSKMTSVLRRSVPFSGDPKKMSELWGDVKYCVFDAPTHRGNYSERHAFARDSISGCDTHIYVIPIEACLGPDHLQTKMEQISNKLGEGVMLYNPTAKYTPGRTPDLLKVKAYQEEDVKFISCNPNSYSFLCEQKNGAQCIVKCSGWEYMFPPPPGTQITIKHNGYFETSQKAKFPFLYRIKQNE